MAALLAAESGLRFTAPVLNATLQAATANGWALRFEMNQLAVQVIIFEILLCSHLTLYNCHFSTPPQPSRHSLTICFRFLLFTLSYTSFSLLVLFLLLLYAFPTLGF